MTKQRRNPQSPLPLKSSDVATLQGLAIRHIDWEGSLVARYSLDDDIEDTLSALAAQVLAEMETSRVEEDALDAVRDCVESAVRGVYAWEYAKLIIDRGSAP